ncbi:hypothetical protein [Reinekea marinisedimentorum]|uniref:Uncharacterized protein n=1 Tax=Reinekea marinisedimentorum TaxID=230495 RepID=A0A4R3I852_9GAMM|nr:hypothetical protein [Reinekea marinisedimentorum]TCS41131.1 hypothetical protein BCF53_107146 [Reinekea marinisedimentorum]
MSEQSVRVSEAESRVLEPIGQALPSAPGEPPKSETKSVSRKKRGYKPATDRGLLKK